MLNETAHPVVEAMIRLDLHERASIGSVVGAQRLAGAHLIRIEAGVVFLLAPLERRFALDLRH